MSGESNLGVWEEGTIETVSVVGRSRAGFRQTVANVFAANGIDVLEARLLGRGDGLVVDSFRVRDDRTGSTVPAQRWDQVRIDLEAGLVGELDTGSKLATRAASYPVAGRPEGPPEARVSIDPATGEMVVVVKCSDRIGRLAEILGVLDECGLDIRLAKLDSREGEVVDTFHVIDAVPSDLADLERRIADAITP